MPFACEDVTSRIKISQITLFFLCFPMTEDPCTWWIKNIDMANPSLFKRCFWKNWDCGFGLGLFTSSTRNCLSKCTGLDRAHFKFETQMGGHLRTPPPCSSYGWWGRPGEQTSHEVPFLRKTQLQSATPHHTSPAATPPTKVSVTTRVSNATHRPGDLMNPFLAKPVWPVATRKS
jgi:hypothetical protein